MNALAAKLGLSKDLTFYDVYSFTDPDLLSFIPRPVYALLVIIPITPSWNESRIHEDAGKEDYPGSGPEGTRFFFFWGASFICNIGGKLYNIQVKLTNDRTSYLVQADNRPCLWLHWSAPLRHQRTREIAHRPWLHVRQDPQCCNSTHYSRQGADAL